MNEKFAGRFEVFVYGGRNTLFSWSQMAFVAPLDEVRGGVDGFILQAGIGGRNSVGKGNGGNNFSSGAGGHSSYGTGSICLVVLMISVLYFVAL